MKILHIASSLNPERGGPTTVVTELTEALADKGLDVSIFTTSKEKQSTYTCRKNIKIATFPTNLLSRIWPFYSLELARALKNQAADFDLIHIHEIWHYPLFASYQAQKKANLPYLVTAHGTLEPYCLKIKALRKKIYSTLFIQKILKQADALHAVSDNEIKDIANFTDNKNIYYIPNGLNMENFKNLPDRKEFEKMYPSVKGKKVILFLGRIHPKKGLDILAEAFTNIAIKRKDVCLLIVGPDNENYQSRIEEFLNRKGALDKTIFTGIITGNSKLAVLSGADIFVLPSYSEGFSISILEAMACALPVVITKKCNFPQVESAQAGRIINNNVTELTNTLTELLDNPELRNNLGASGEKLVRDEYTWDKLADKMINCYEEIINNHKNPQTLNR